MIWHLLQKFRLLKRLSKKKWPPKNAARHDEPWQTPGPELTIFIPMHHLLGICGSSRLMRSTESEELKGIVSYQVEMETITNLQPEVRHGSKLNARWMNWLGRIEPSVGPIARSKV